MASSPSHGCLEKKHWWLTNKKIVDKYVKDARSLIASQQENHIASALNLLDAALALSPTSEIVLHLKATSLLHLRKFKQVADMLQDYIPSINSSTSSSSSSSSSDNNSQPLTKEKVKLLSSAGANSDRSFTCFSVSDLKKKLMDGLAKNYHKEDQWRYLVLGEACCHLGLMEDAMALLQTGKRLASAAFRRQSICWSDDSFISSGDHPQTTTTAESDTISHLLTHIKLLLRRKTAAMAAAEAGLYSEAIRHFSKIVDGRRGCSPQGFLAECYMHRAAAYRSSGRIADAIADCNRTLALDPSCIEALNTRASLFETIHCLPDSLHDLEHLKFLYNSILRDRKLPGPAWKRQNVGYGEIPGKLCCIGRKIEELKRRVGSGEIGNVDYYGLMGLRRGCSRSELERAHLLLTIRHKPDKCTSFMDRCEFGDEGEMDSIRDRAKMSGLLLYRLIQRGYTNLMRIVMDEEAMEKQIRKKASSLHLQQAMQVQQKKQEKKNGFQGVFCRDMAVVGNLLSQAGGCNRPIAPIPIKYEALSC